MRAILITYDLNAPGKSYAALHEAIKGIGEWWHYLESVWIVRASLTPSQVWDRISHACDASDQVLILDITGDARYGWLPQAAWDWLNQAL